MFAMQKSLPFIPEAIPELIRNSPLMKKGGFDVFVGLLDDHAHIQMLAEAMSLFTTARVSEVLTPDNEDGRGGNPPRRYLTAPGGPIQDAFYHSDGVRGLYPDRIYEPLSAIRDTLDEKAIGVRLMPKQTIVLFGGIVPHMLLPVAYQQVRIISVLCYRVPLPAI